MQQEIIETQIRRWIAEKKEIAKTNGEPFFMGFPDSWYEPIALYCCKNAHLNNFYIKSERFGHICPQCHSHLFLCPPSTTQAEIDLVVNEPKMIEKSMNPDSLLHKIGFVVGINQGEVWLVEKTDCPNLKKYAVYDRQFVSFGPYFLVLNRGKTIDKIIEVEGWYWSGDDCENSRKTFELLSIIEKEDIAAKNAIKIKYDSIGSNKYLVVSND